MLEINARRSGYLFAAAVLVAGCSDDAATDGGGGEPLGGSVNAGAGDTGGEGPRGGANEGGGGGGSPTAELEVVVDFDETTFELPEGLFIAGDSALVGFGTSGAVDSFALPGAERSAFATFPLLTPDVSFMTGVTLAPDDSLLAAIVSFSPDLTAGVYRAATQGEQGTLWASHPQMVFPNGFAWHEGDLYVTDSAFGGVFKIDSAGIATPWLVDPTLSAQPTACGGAADSLAVGANGVVEQAGSLYIASSNQGILVKVPVSPEGEPGPLEIVAGPDCDALAGIDGITLDSDGSIIAAVNAKNRIVRITESGAISTIVEGGPLDFPASVAFAGSGAERALYITSFAVINATTGQPANPGLLRLAMPQ